MKNLLILVGVIFLGGCLVRSYTVDKPRVDLEIEGNQGCLFGVPKEEVKKKRLGSTRKVTFLEIEFGAHGPKELGARSRGEVDYPEITSGNKEPVVRRYRPTPRKKPYQYRYYTVKKKDTLQKISHKFYRTSKKWKIIYEANDDVIKSPNKIYPGLTLKIPILK